MSGVAYQPRYTISDYLQWEGDWELWNGLAVAMSPSPSRRHQAIARDLVFQLGHALAEGECGGCQLYYELDWHVDETTVVRPDALIVCDHPTDGEFIIEPPSFVAEILSPSTAAKDCTAKKDLYQHQGVNYYLIVDPDGTTCQLFRLAPDGVYRPSDPATAMSLHSDCEIKIDPNQLW